MQQIHVNYEKQTVQKEEIATDPIDDKIMRIHVCR